MTREEYDARMKEIEKEFSNAKSKLAHEYGCSQIKYKVGDIVEDHKERIRVETIRIRRGFGAKYPEPVYIGPVLRKDNTPRKNGSIGEIYTSDIIGFCVAGSV